MGPGVRGWSAPLTRNIASRGGIPFRSFPPTSTPTTRSPSVRPLRGNTAQLPPESAPSRGVCKRAPAFRAVRKPRTCHAGCGVERRLARYPRAPQARGAPVPRPHRRRYHRLERVRVPRRQHVKPGQVFALPDARCTGGDGPLLQGSPRGVGHTDCDLAGRLGRVARVEAGVMVAHDPPHRSGRAALPRPARALGDNAQANQRVGVTDARGRKPSADVARHPMPRETMGLAAPQKNPPPQPPH
jgi:hypothetical protein